MVTRFVTSSLLVMFPVHLINCSYLWFAVVQVASMMIISAGHFIPSAAGAFLLIGMSIYGVTRAVGMFPYLLLYKHFNQPEDVTAVNI